MLHKAPSSVALHSCRCVVHSLAEASVGIGDDPLSSWGNAGRFGGAYAARGTAKHLMRFDEIRLTLSGETFEDIETVCNTQCGPAGPARCWGA